MDQTNSKTLYHPSFEHDSCGIGFVANIKGKKSHQIVEDAITMLQNMEHRGATGSDPKTGDGAGILIQIPHQFFVEECKKIGIDLPEEGKYGVGMLYLPADVKIREACRRSLNIHIEEMGFELLGYRDVPRQKKTIGKTAQEFEPKIEQIFVQPQKNLDPDVLERKLFVLRNYSTHYIGKNIAENRGQFYFSTLSHRTVVYKGQFTTSQVREYYLDLQDERVVSALGLVHSRFSTNTFPKWKLAQPFRFIAHNGEINTIRGNVNWMHSKETLFESSLFTKDEMQKLIPICDASHSDSANLDAMIEMLVMGGRPLPHVLMMLIPEAWQGNTTMDEKKRAFYQYHASLTEAWDGPASICFTDGNVVGAMLDRNGLRPSRFCITSDDRIIMASEAGALRIEPSLIIKKGRLEPGKIFIADLKQGRVISDQEIKDEICSKQNYKRWLELNSTKLDDLKQPQTQTSELTEEKLLTAQQAYGFTRDDLKFILAPMATETKEPIGSMGADVPLAVLSNHSQHVSNYFKQLFAQVSNPPIDPIRERMVMSLRVYMGKIFNILSETPLHCKQIEIRQPVITNEETDKIKNISHSDFRTFTLDAVFPADQKPGSLEKALDDMCRKADAAILDHGVNILLISDRKIDEKHAPIPSLLSVGVLHQHLIKNGLRVRTGFIVEAGDVRETHHFATLIGYGATAVNPYMAFESIKALRKQRLIPQEIDEKQAFKNYMGAIGKGLLKIFSKMGISTLQSYQGAQIFEAIGLSQKVIDKCFAGTVSRLGGLDFDGLAKEVLVRHKLAFPKIPVLISRLAEGGIYQWRRRGENHLFNPDTIHLLQQSTRRNDYNLYKQYATRINDQTKHNFTLRGLLDFKKQEPIPIEEVESKEKIFKRFATGAMSFGSLSHEAHSTLAIAMNRIGGKSNSGEGGEDEIRFEQKANGDWERSAIKQVASGRFGVTANYLTNADELQIKMAQGAKPGEGGQLPGHKVDDWIGRVRHSTPGVALISPPPHHDIYSIEDLAQLIFDLKNANRKARINVKLVSKAGVGTIAVGVSKAHADVILISGHDGGTGASPLSSIHHTGTPWELGLVESHQTLVKNKLRSRVTLQVDGQIRTGRDLAIATLLGAEEWGISTAALIVEGCVMMRKCHLNTCPVGVATQNKELRKLFKGKPEFVINYFSFMAEELREIMASLGFRTIDEMVGQADLLKAKDDVKLWKAKDLDLSPLIYKMPEIDTFYKTVEQDHQIDKVLDWKLLKKAEASIKTGKPSSGEFAIYNTNRTVGALLSNEITKKYKGQGLPQGTIHFKFRGSAGQSFGAFNTSGILLELEGETNDYFGKGLSGAQLVIYPDRTSKYKANENVIVGNVAFYGATSGEAYIRGVAGERFCVRNSGAKVVVEGIGAHGCEYMTGGIVINLGGIGRNFAAGMSGGVVYLYDPKRGFKKYLNPAFKDYDTIDYEDDGIIKSMIEKHIKFTQSDVAEKIIENWDLEVNNFIKIMPEEYRLALKKMRKTQEEHHTA